MLRLTARRTWRFFETFVGPEDHALPPDNFQEEPTPVVAHRTSPTNLGLYLLSIIAAHDFGWIGTVAAIERLEATLGTMNGLERFRGHFYNWYDTRDLRPLDPKYISSVDSGNLAGHLIALGQACQEIIDRPLLGPHVLSGIADAILLLRQAARAIVDDRRTQTVTRKHLDEALDALTAALSPVPMTPGDWVVRLTELEARAHTMVDIARTLTAERGDSADAELLAWAEAVRRGHRESCARSRRGNALGAACLWQGSPKSRDDARTRFGFDDDGARFSLGPDPGRYAGPLRERHTRTHDAPRTRGDRTAPHRAMLLRESMRSSRASRVLPQPAEALVRRLSTLVAHTKTMFDAMEFGFLFDPTRKLFSIGYRVADNSLDPSCYDLLASEARLTSFIAIAKGDVPATHWFHLGRALTPVDRGSALVSWSGSMFEYLMPVLVMRSPSGSLLGQTVLSSSAVRENMEPNAAFRGAFQNRPTTRAISS